MKDICFAAKKNGQKCGYRATIEKTGLLPTCRIHQRHEMMRGYCRALLDDGAKCSEMFEWKPGGINLCASHCGTSPCYFLNVPKEIRLNIYRFLLPGDPIVIIQTDYHPSSIYNLFRVNQKIYDEATTFFYGSMVFTMETLAHQWEMHTASRLIFQRDAPIDSRSEINFNTKRIVPGWDSRGRGSRSAVHDGIELATKLPLLYAHRIVGPVWKPRLNEKYFNMIRFFKVQIDLTLPNQRRRARNRFGSKSVEEVLYRYCDQLHKLIGRLQVVRKPNALLEIDITFRHDYQIIEDMYFAAEVVLKPFRRLRNFAGMKIQSITVVTTRGSNVDLITHMIHFKAGSKFSDFIKSWPVDRPSLDPASGTSLNFDIYWELESLINKMTNEYRDSEGRLQSFVGLLDQARVARESEDDKSFGQVLKGVAGVWQNFSREQRFFQSTIENSIADMSGELMVRDLEDNTTGQSA